MTARRIQCPTFVRVLPVIMVMIMGSALRSSAEESLVSLRISTDANRVGSGHLSTLTILLHPLDRHGDDLRISFNLGTAFEVRIVPGRYQVSTERAVKWGTQWFMWDLEVPVTNPNNDLHLRVDNAITFSRNPEEEGVKSETVSTVKKSEAKKSEAKASTAGIPAQARTSTADYIPPPVVLSSPATPLQSAIINVLERWIQAVHRRDLDALMSCYAPTLSRYFLQQNVSWAGVKLDKQRFFQRFSEIRKLEIRDLRISSTPQGTEASLTKSWDFGGDINFSGEVVSYLVFRNYKGRWLISAERERAIWVRRVVDQSAVTTE